MKDWLKMLFTNVAIFLLVVYFCVAQQLNDKYDLSAESSRENSRRFHTNGKPVGRRWTVPRNSPYQRVVSSAEREVPVTKDEENNGRVSTEHSDRSKEKSKKIKRFTSRVHLQNATESPLDVSTTGNTSYYVEVGRSRGNKDYSGSQRRRRISSESDFEHSTSSSNKRRRMPTIPTTTNVPQTMSYSLYNYFRPLEQDVPQDDILPFLDFGRKLSPVVPTPSGVNSIENKSTVSRLRIHVTEPSVTPTDDETVHEEMDLNFDRTVVERNSVPRGRLHSSPNISNLYRKPNTQTSRTADNLIITSDCVTPPSLTHGLKKYPRVQGRQVESRKNRSICGTAEAETVIPRNTNINTEDTTKQTIRKIKDVEIISNIKTPYKSSELKLEDVKARSAISAEPSNVKAIFKDVRGSDLFNSDNTKLNSTTRNSTDMPPVFITPNSTKDLRASTTLDVLQNVENTTNTNYSDRLHRNTKAENIRRKNIYDADRNMTLLNRNNKVENTTKLNTYNTNVNATLQNNNDKFIQITEMSNNNKYNYNSSYNNNKTMKDRPVQIKPIVRNNFRHYTLTKKAFQSPLSQLRIENTTLPNNTLTNITKPDIKEFLAKQRVPNITESNFDNVNNFTVLKTAANLLPINTTSTPDGQKSKILSTAVVTSVSVQESNSSSTVTESPNKLLNTKLNKTDQLSELLQRNHTHISLTNLTSDDQSNQDFGNVSVINDETKNVEETFNNEDLTTIELISTTAMTPTSEPVVNYTSTEAELSTNITLLNETTAVTESVVITTTETTPFIPLVPEILPNVTITNVTDDSNVTNQITTINNTEIPLEMSTLSPAEFESTVVSTTEPSEISETPFDTTTTSVITLPPEETTLPREEETVAPTVLPPPKVVPSDKGSATDAETAVVKEEKNNITTVLSTAGSDVTQKPNTLVVPNNTDYEDVEVAYQEGIGITTYILVFLGVVPIVLGATVAGRFLVLHSRKKVLDESEYSSEYNRSPLGIGAASPLPTKLPRVPTHLGWEMEKSAPTILPTASARWEFPREKLRLQTLLGQGNFGQVWKAEADDISGHEGLTRLVAVKTVKESANTREREDLLRELGIMQDLGSHPNVVTLLGCCTEKEPYFLIMEYVMYGKMLAFLRDHRTRAHYYNFSDATDALTSRDLTVFAYCVARGMDYLSNKGIIHRDLAARNILVDHNKLCKIADFGMSRNVSDTGQIYEQRQSKGALPIRWMAPESLHFSLFTHKSDVWSFGILMWEIVTLGSTPYATMGAREVMKRVRDGYRLERPSHCRIELFRVISRCWHSDPNKRPTFAELKQEIGQLLGDAENGGGYVDLESLADEIKQSMHSSSSLQRKH